MWKIGKIIIATRKSVYRVEQTISEWGGTLTFRIQLDKKQRGGKKLHPHYSALVQVRCRSNKLYTPIWIIFEKEEIYVKMNSVCFKKKLYRRIKRIVDLLYLDHSHWTCLSNQKSRLALILIQLKTTHSLKQESLA